MYIVILTFMAALATAAPQFPLENGFTNTPHILRAILLPVVPQITVPQIENRQIIPSGSQILLLHPVQQQSQLSFIHSAPPGQIVYLQGLPQQILSDQQLSALPEPSPQQGSEPYFPLTNLNPESLGQKPLDSEASTYQSKHTANNQKSSLQKTSESLFKSVAPSKGQSSPYRSAYKSGHDGQQSSASYKGSYSSGSPGQPGQGGVKGYVTLRQNQDDNFDGNFQYNFETDHGIVVDVVGSVKNPGTEDQIQVIQGSYSYKNPDGTVITTKYTADEKGFVAQGDHLPTPPPLPEAIAKSLAYIASHPSTEDKS